MNSISMPSNVVENYLKAIYHLSDEIGGKVNTNAIAEHLSVKSSTVTDMLKKLEQMKLVKYEKYQGVELTKSGRNTAINIVRKHRLWEVFLVEKLQFNWSEVHVVAEQLEHVESAELIDKLDEFLEFPKWDPHGDPIPNKLGVMEKREQTQLSLLKPGDKAVMLGVSQDNKSLLQYLESVQLTLGSNIQILHYFDFDNSIEVEINKKKIHLSSKAAESVIVKKTH